MKFPVNPMRVFSTHSTKQGFSLIEVVLAIGVFLVSVLALIGLLAPMLQSVDEVEKIDEITSVVNTVNAFLQSSSEIAFRDGTTGNITQSKFDGIYRAVANTAQGGGVATVFVYRYYDANDAIRLEVGFSPEENSSGIVVGENSIVNEPDSNPADFNNAAGSIFRVVLTASSVTPLLPTPLRSDPRDTTTGVYTLLVDNPDDYPEGYLAFEARIFAEDPPGPDGTFAVETDLEALNQREPDFTFNTAIVR